VGVFWTDQASEPASVRRYYRIIAASIVLLVVTLMGIASWLSAGSKTSK
jgi:flagellar basal body-associated protein FliL